MWFGFSVVKELAERVSASGMRVASRVAFGASATRTDTVRMNISDWVADFKHYFRPGCWSVDALSCCSGFGGSAIEPTLADRARDIGLASRPMR